MARISGVDLPKNKRVEIGLTYIYGIGRITATNILSKSHVNPNIRCKNLTDKNIKNIINTINKLKIIIEGDLKRNNALNIKRLKEINCYRGIRHRNGFPVRGQRTRTNAKTRKKFFNKKYKYN